MTERTDRLNQIRKLLAKSEADGVTAAEGESLYNKAFELAARYEIDWELAKQKEPEHKPDVVGEPRRGTVVRPFHQMFVLTAIVYRFCGADIVTTGKDTYTAHGTDADLDRAEILLVSILLQGMRWQLNDYRNSGAADNGERRSTYKRSWWSGYSNSLFDRFTRIKGAAVKQADATSDSGTPGVALMLRDKEALVKASIASRHGRLRKGRGSSTSGSGYGSGKAAGERADIGGSTLTGHQRAIGR